MTQYLNFRLYGPLASWGEVAVGEVRPTAAWPGRSAIIGLLAAALGIRRDDEPRQLTLASNLGVAICIHAGGELLRDYHTIQMPPKRKGVDHRTRRDELESETLNTLLSQRDYRADALYTVVAWCKDSKAAPTLEQLKDALSRPRFTLYLGRKACPPGLPMSPHIVSAECLRGAFDQTRFPDEDLLRWLPRDNENIYVWEASHTPGMDALHVRPRRDEPTSRRRWQFAEREEYYRSEAAPEATGRDR